MRTLLPLVLALGLAIPASAQEVTFYDDNGDGEPDVLIPSEAWPEWTVRGIGSPTVVYDEVGAQWVMFFEARLSDAFLDDYGGDWTQCQNADDRPRVVWGIGRATSPDGLTGWEVDPEPVVMPEPGTWRACQTTHPWVVAESADRWHLYYKAEQGFRPCPDDTEPPSWGCGRMTGVGYAFSDDGGQTWDVSDSAEPTLPETDFGFPTVVARQEADADFGDNTWTMLLTRPDGLYLAQSDDPLEGWAFDESNPVLAPGTWNFAQDAWFQPSLVCNPVDDSFAYSAWIGGSTGTDVSGFDKLNSEDGFEWFGDGRPVIEWQGEPAWRHWDVVRVGEDAYVYYTTRNEEDGLIRPRLLKVGDTPEFDLDPALWSGRACFYGEGPPPEDTGDPTEPTDTDPLIGGNDDGEGCYCNSTTAPVGALPLVGGLLLLAAGRRRRAR